jgi:hypothetical protein
MNLENFADFTAWPMSTNLVYIQLSIGEEIINNMNIFLDGTRSYGTTYLQGKVYNYVSRSGKIEKIHASDVELLTSYFRMELTKKKVPDWDFYSPVELSSYLPYDPTIATPDPSDPNFQETVKWTRDRISFLHNMQELLDDYGTANRASRPEMESLRRRWQFFLNLKKRNKECYHDYDSFRELMYNKYPLIQEDFLFYLDIRDEDSEPIFDFYIYIYSIFLNGTLAHPEDPEEGLNDTWPIDYIDVLFGGLFIEADFLQWYFNPVMDLFIRYFFPIEMDYINDLIPKISIKDKWNSVSYDDNQSMRIKSGNMSLLPVANIDHARFHTELYRHDWFQKYDIRASFISKPLEEEYKINDYIASLPMVYQRDPIEISDIYDTRITHPAEGTRSQRIRGCVKTSGTKEYKDDMLASLSNIINNIPRKEKK